MKASSKALELIKSFEGFRDTAYLCPAKKWTIGFGSTLGVLPGQTITREQAEQALAVDVALFEAALTKALKVQVTQSQFDALVCFAYNCGGWRQSTLLRLVNAGRPAEAARQFDLWVHAGGKKLAGLVKRRAAEKALFVSGAHAG
jgi:lysozyme